MKRFISVLLAITFVFALGAVASARLVGDVDSNGKTNSTDALKILQYSVGKTNVAINPDYADVNGDKKINSTDALIVLKIAVGNYDGDLEVDEDLVTNYKAQIIDPVMSTGKYTFTTEVETNGKLRTVTVMIKDDDMCVETGEGSKVIRMLYLDGKAYLVYPMNLGVINGFYAESESEPDLNVSVPAKVTYIGSEKVKVGGVEYVCESYRHADGTVTEYYFKDGKWAMMGKPEDGDTQLKKIISFKKGVDDSYFSLNGYKPIDLSSKA